MPCALRSAGTKQHMFHLLQTIRNIMCTRTLFAHGFCTSIVCVCVCLTFNLLIILLSNEHSRSLSKTTVTGSCPVSLDSNANNFDINLINLCIRYMVAVSCVIYTSIQTTYLLI
jgi:hypothetical protein